MQHMIDSIVKTVKNWWASLIVGILSIIIGICCIAMPVASLLALTYVFIVGFMATGLLNIYFAVTNRNYLFAWGWPLVEGIIEFLLGLALLVIPPVLVTTILVYLVGFWILFRSIWGISEARQLQTLGIKGWGWMLGLCIACVALSIIYLLSPAFNMGIFLIALVGCTFMVFGVYRIAISFILRSLGKKIDAKRGE